MGEKSSAFVAILVLVVIGYGIFALGGAKITANLAAREDAAARVEVARADQVRAIQEARIGIEQARQDSATQRADSRNVTLAAITAMGIAAVSANPIDTLLFAAVGVVIGFIVKGELDRRPRG